MDRRDFGRISRASLAYSCCIVLDPFVSIRSTTTKAGRGSCAIADLAKGTKLARTTKKTAVVLTLRNLLI